MNQGISTREVAEEASTGWGWEDVICGGITLKVTEMLEEDILDAKTGGVKGEDQGNYPCSV